MRIREISWFHLKRDMMQQSGSEDSGDNHPDLSGLDFLHKQALPSWPLVVSPDFTHTPSLPFLHISDKRNSTGLRLGSIIGIALGVLLGLALMAALGCLLLHTRSRRVSPCCDLKELRSPASTPGHGAASRCTYPDSLPSSTAAVPMYQELQHPEKNIYCQINHKAEVAS